MHCRLLISLRNRCTRHAHYAATCLGPFRTTPHSGEWPDGRFDLIVLSEVLYFLHLPRHCTVAARVLAALDTDGVVLSVNWRGHGDDPCGGDEAAIILLNETYQVLARESRYCTALIPHRVAGPALRAGQS